MKKTHNLKIEEQYLQDLLSGKKTFEIRLNDRDYQVGDTLLLAGYRFIVTYIHAGLGLQDGYVCMSVELEDTKE